MELHITFSENQPMYIAIYEQIQQKIKCKSLQAHERIPAKRQLAKDLNVSVQTVQLAYEQLLSEGYIYSKERSGYFISDIDVVWEPIIEAQQVQPIDLPIKSFVDLRNGQVDSAHFPLKVWQKLYKQQLNSLDFTNAPWQGEQSLRQEIARYVYKARGIQCVASQVFIYSGTQQQLQSLMHFLKPTAVAVEEPGFIRAKATLQQLNIQTKPIQIDQHGATVPKVNVDAYYVTPAHQFPLGYVMPLERKVALLNWAKSNNSYLIEDDYDAEFRYQGLPIPSLGAIDCFERVIYFGAFSKTLIPSLRISYMILPPHLVEPFEQFHAFQKSTVSKIDQQVIAQMMQQGYNERHIAKMRTLYKKKHHLLLQALQQHLPNDFNVTGVNAGLHVIIQLPDWLTETEAISKAGAIDYIMDPVSTSYMYDKPTQFVMLGFGSLPLEQINEVIKNLATVWDSK